MQVVIKYTQYFGESPNGIDIINVPILNEYEKSRINFNCLEDNHWALVVEHWVLDKQDLTYKWQNDEAYENLLKSDTECDALEYRNWLLKYIDYIEVDGREFWINNEIHN